MISRFHACVDIGGTKVAVALADGQSQQNLVLYSRLTEPTVKEGDAGALAEQIIRMVDAACL